MATKVDESSPGDFILSTASSGEAIMADLLIFANKWPTGYSYILDIICENSLTIDTLKQISKAINRLDGELKVTGGPLMDICKCVSSDFQMLKRALDRSREKLDNEDGVPNVYGSWVSVGGGSRVADTKTFQEPNPNLQEVLWGELGGNMRAEELRENLLEAMRYLWNFGPALTFMALKRQEKENVLSPEESRELKRLASGIQKTLERVEAWKPDTIEFAARYRKSRDTQTFEDGQYGQSAKYREFDVTDRARRAIDDDAVSVASFISDGPNQWIDAKEIYEAWNLTGVEPRGSRGVTWTIFGIPAVKQRWESLGCHIEASRMTNELYAEVSSEQTQTTESARKASIEKIMSQWPGRTTQDVELLLEDRRRSTSRSRLPRHWQIYDIKPQYEGTPVSNEGWRSWWQTPRKPYSWLIILKVTTISNEPWSTPDRFRDPFFKVRPERIVEYDRSYQRWPKDVIIESRRPERPVVVPLPDNGVQRLSRSAPFRTEHKRRSLEQIEADLASIVAELTSSGSRGESEARERTNL